MEEEIEIGAEAPDFALPCVTGEKKGLFKLSELRGEKNVVLAFYALDWTSSCASELPALDGAQALFAEQDAQLAGISVDSIPSHEAWQKYVIGQISFPLCSDFFPHAEVVSNYGLLREGPPVPGISNRAVIVVDKKGKVAWKKVYDLATVPDINEILEGLKAVNAKEASTE